MALEIAPVPTSEPAELVGRRIAFRRRATWFGLAAGLVIIGFFRPLWDLAGFASGNDLYSHILLIPFISGYLIWLKRGELDPEFKPAPWLAGVALAIGIGVLGYWWAVEGGWQPRMEDYLAFMMVSFLCLTLSAGLLFLGSSTIRRLAFPLAFLVFAVPFPAKVVDLIESFLQHGSAEMAYWLFSVSGTPVLRNGTLFQLPGISLQVAPECSGIHSSIVLFISSLLGGYVLLRTGWRRGVLAVAVIPLAFLRNGFRIFVIGELCVNVTPEMIHSYIHRKGGPIFFALSLVPFFALLLLLQRSEMKRLEPRMNTDGHGLGPQGCSPKSV